VGPGFESLTTHQNLKTKRGSDSVIRTAFFVIEELRSGDMGDTFCRKFEEVTGIR